MNQTYSQRWKRETWMTTLSAVKMREITRKEMMLMKRRRRAWKRWLRRNWRKNSRWRWTWGEKAPSCGSQQVPSCNGQFSHLVQRRVRGGGSSPPTSELAAAAAVRIKHSLTSHRKVFSSDNNKNYAKLTPVCSLSFSYRWNLLLLWLLLLLLSPPRTIIAWLLGPSSTRIDPSTDIPMYACIWTNLLDHIHICS